MILFRPTCFMRDMLNPQQKIKEIMAWKKSTPSKLKLLLTTTRRKK